MYLAKLLGGGGKEKKTKKKKKKKDDKDKQSKKRSRLAVLYGDESSSGHKRSRVEAVSTSAPQESVRPTPAAVARLDSDSDSDADPPRPQVVTKTTSARLNSDSDSDANPTRRPAVKVLCQTIRGQRFPCPTHALGAFCCRNVSANTLHKRLKHRHEFLVGGHAKSPRNCSSARCMRTLAIAMYSGDISQPTNRKPSPTAALPVLPEPMNGSKTTPPGGVTKRHR